MAAVESAPRSLTLSSLELATVASRLGHEPWSALARRAAGITDPRVITRDACIAAAARLSRRGLIVAGPAAGTVEVHPAVAVAAAILARAEILVEAVASGGRQSLLLPPDAATLLVDDRPGEDLILTVLDLDVPVTAAVTSLVDDGFAPHLVRVATAGDAQVAVVRRDGEQLTVTAAGGPTIRCRSTDEAAAAVAALVEGVDGAPGSGERSWPST